MKIFNFGLPRTGTTSLHNFLLSNNIDSIHTNNGLIETIYPIEYNNFLQDKPNNLLSKLINQHTAFGDLPWYSLYEKIISDSYGDKDIYFLATYRDPNDWYESMKKIRQYMFYPNNTKLYHKYIYGDLIQTMKKKDLITFFHNHYNSLIETTQKYGKKLFILDLKDIQNIVDTLSKIITIHNYYYPKIS